MGSQSFCGGAAESPTNGVLMTFFEEEENGGFVEEEQVEDDESIKEEDEAESESIVILCLSLTHFLGWAFQVFVDKEDKMVYLQMDRDQNAPLPSLFHVFISFPDKQ